MEGGNDSGAIRIGRTVRRPVRSWTASVHELLRHLETKEFEGAPRVLGVDADGREILTYLEGDTIGGRRVWPEWTRAEDTLRQVAAWVPLHARLLCQGVADDLDQAVAELEGFPLSGGRQEG
jgi:hypothetical protein